MALIEIDGSLLKEMILTAASLLQQNRENVDALNVFPVPDGDTGTNMSLTMTAAAKEIRDMETNHAGRIAEAAARGALKGARGNSGVILSQLYRGFARQIDGNERIDAELFASALRAGSETAYKAVMKPKEGTILTVARTIAEDVSKPMDDFFQLMESMLESGERALKATPDQLPVLKQAGVVDAGGKGLLLIYAGYKMAIDGEEIDIKQFDIGAAKPRGIEMVSEEEGEGIEFGYCTEFFIKNFLPKKGQKDIEKLRERLGLVGDCVLVVGDRLLTKVHVHSNAPGKILQMALSIGELSNIKIDNMREQHRSIIEGSEQFHSAMPVQNGKREPYAIVAVSSGDGLNAVFRDLSVQHIVEGGQTMNPSIEDLRNAIENANADVVYVLPNNSNIILAAQQAAELSDCSVKVIGTKSVPQGIAAVLAFQPDADADVNASTMLEAAKSVRTGQVTYAVRDTNFDGREIHANDILGLIDGKIKEIGDDVEHVMRFLMKDMIHNGNDLITIFYGKDVQKENAEALCADLAREYSSVDFELLSGGQPLYYYLFSVE